MWQKITAVLTSSFLLLNKGAVQAENNDVLVLVHGLGGSAASFEYRQELEQAGLRTIAVEINPYASNWDRACELFAQLKGLNTDYGNCHVSDYSSEGHVNVGPNYENQGLYPQWDANHKIHLMGHSLGGQTIRTLERLLEEGSGCSSDTSELFQGGNDWITSVTTLASPLDGTTVFEDIIFGWEDLLINVFISFGVQEGSLAFPQWGLVQQPGEDFDDFLDRIEESGLYDSQDFSIFDMRVSGSKFFNDNGKQAYDGRYYFSVATERTNPERSCNLFFFSCETIEVPDDAMAADLRVSGTMMGKGDNQEDRKNDGIVNQRRERAPGGENFLAVDDRNEIEWNAGEWHSLSLDYLDHYQITDRDDRNDNNNYAKSAKKLYLEHGVRIKSLPSTSIAELSEAEIFAAHERFLKAKHLVASERFMIQDFEGEVTYHLNKSRVAGFTILMMIVTVGISVMAVRFTNRPAFDKMKARMSPNKWATEEGEVSKVTV